jgi:hypothetical protein
MIIHEPILKNKSGEICVSSRFELQTSLPYLPSELWYCFPEKYEQFLVPRADGFAATALLVAMFAGEDLTIRGPISPKLAYGLYDYRNIFHDWFPKLYRMVDIQYEQLDPPQRLEEEGAIATAFSGGVDSFYTLWSHLPENQQISRARVTHGLFIHGLDSRLDDKANFLATAKHYADLFASLGLELIQASTNAYQFAEFRINWLYFSGAPLIGTALLLNSFFRCFYVPSGFPSLKKLIPNGSHPITDHLLSTETMDVVHHGAETGRYDKLAVISKWPVSYDRLRVCTDKQRLVVLQNCSACDKCYRTMTALDLLDSLPNYKNFSQKLTVIDYLRWGSMTLMNMRHARDFRRIAWQSGRFDMVFWINVAITLRKVAMFLRKIIKALISPEQLFWIKRKVYQPEAVGPEGKDDHPPA